MKRIHTKNVILKTIIICGKNYLWSFNIKNCQGESKSLIFRTTTRKSSRAVLYSITKSDILKKQISKLLSKNVTSICEKEKVDFV